MSDSGESVEIPSPDTEGARNRRSNERRDLHPDVRGRFRALMGSSPGGAPHDILLCGPPGIGKSRLLQWAWQQAFRSPADIVPIAAQIPAFGFRPRAWARSLLRDGVRQWLARERRDPRLARTRTLTSRRLAELCRAQRLGRLVELLDALETFHVEGAPGSVLVELALDAFEEAAAALRRRVLLLIDGADGAFWREEGETFHLARVMGEAAPGDALVRRVWTSSVDPADAHPLLGPPPPADVVWTVSPLTSEGACEFFDAEARACGLDYDRPLLHDRIHLWGGVPGWLANFARRAAETPRALTRPDQLLDVYIEDLREGPTAWHFLRAFSEPDAEGEPPMASRLAQVAETCLDWSVFRPGEGSGGWPPPEPAEPASDAETRALSRLARTGLAMYRSGRWQVSDVPALADFLDLYVSRHFRREDAHRREILVKRRRISEFPAGGDRADRLRRFREMLLVMHTFRGQEAPAPLLNSHLRHAGAWSLRGEFARTGAPDISAEKVRLPRCLNAFVHEDVPWGDRPEWPDAPEAAAALWPAVVVGWCFDGPGYLRREERLWVGVSSDADVLTAVEVDALERLLDDLRRDFEIARATVWIVTDARLAPEAVARLTEPEFHVSTRADFETLGRALLEGSGEAPTFSGDEDFEDAPTPAPSQRQAFAPEAASGEAAGHGEPAGRGRTEAVVEDSGGHFVKMRLPARPEMEVVAARAAEQLAKRYRFGESTTGQIRMATLEGCLNAIENSPGPEKDVLVHLEVTEDRMVIIVENEGTAFDSRLPSEPGRDAKTPQPGKRGWGLKLMEKFMDRVVFEPVGGGARLRLEKRRPRSSVAGKSQSVGPKAPDG